MLAEQLDSIREDYPPQALAASMNLIGSHDTRRALTEAGNNKGLLKMMAVMQFTWPGMPTIYYGDEAGLIGGRDPDDRRTFPWGSEDTALVDFYKMLAGVRRDTSPLRTGDYLSLGFDNKLDYYAYARKDAAGAAIVALTRGTKEVPVELSVAGVIADGTTLVDRLNGDAEYTVSGGKLQLTLKPQWGVLLVPKK
jgi:glycosidase